MEAVIGYILQFEYMYIYVLIQFLCLAYSAFIDKDLKQTLTIFIIMAASLLSPLVRACIPEDSLFSGSVGFFNFYMAYELISLVALTLINYNEKSMYPLYILHLLGVALNWWCANHWEVYSQFIYDYYEIVNKVLLDNILLATVDLTSIK